MTRRQYHLASALTLCLAANLAMGQSAGQAGAEAQANETPVNRPNVSSTSNTTKADDTLRDRQMEEILVSAKASSLSLGGGLMSVQTAPKAVSTFIKLNCSNLANRRAFTNANNASAFLTANQTGIKDDSGVTLGASAPTYSLLEPRTFMVTVGGSLF